MPSRRPAGRVLRKMAFHNGTESRKMLPLRKKEMTAMASGRPIEWAQRDRAFHNGTESRETLPLRKKTK